MYPFIRLPSELAGLSIEQLAELHFLANVAISQNLTSTAKKMGMGRSTLYRKLREIEESGLLSAYANFLESDQEHAPGTTGDSPLSIQAPIDDTKVSVALDEPQKPGRQLASPIDTPRELVQEDYLAFQLQHHGFQKVEEQQGQEKWGYWHQPDSNLLVQTMTRSSTSSPIMFAHAVSIGRKKVVDLPNTFLTPRFVKLHSASTAEKSNRISGIVVSAPYRNDIIAQQLGTIKAVVEAMDAHLLPRFVDGFDYTDAHGLTLNEKAANRQPLPSGLKRLCVSGQSPA